MYVTYILRIEFRFSEMRIETVHAREKRKSHMPLNVVHKLRTIKNNYFRVAYVLQIDFISLWRAPCVSTPERNKAPFVVHKLRTKKNN